MSRFNIGASKHHIERVGRDHFRLSWTFDTYLGGSRLRWPRTIRRDTDLAGALRFARKWNLPAPVEAANQKAFG